MRLHSGTLLAPGGSMNRTRISIVRVAAGGPYQIVADVHSEATIEAAVLLKTLAALFGIEAAGQLKTELIDENGSFAAEVSLVVEKICVILNLCQGLR